MGQEAADRHKVFVGLGNVGSKYEMTRHNMGFLVVKALASSLGWSFKEEARFSSFVAKGDSDNTRLHLLLPTTYMNLSGIAVSQYLDFYKLSAKDLVVVSDDIAIPFGEMRLRLMGSPGGHNGLKSIQQYLRTSHYTRLRMGIGDREKGSLADHVLGTFSQHEKAVLDSFIDKGAFILRQLLLEDAAKLMNEVNVAVNSHIKKEAKDSQQITPLKGQENQA